MKIINHIAVLCFTIMAYGICFASNLADPAVIIPPDRIAAGVSYHAGGYSITNDTVPCILNRIMANISYSPFQHVTIGISAGATQMDIAKDTTAKDTFGLYHSGYGFSGGAHLSVGTPMYFNNSLGLVGILQGTYFSTKNDLGAMYSGLDANGGLGLQYHVSDFGYITAGSSVYMIFGKNKGYNGAEGKYSNINNVRGWLAIDYFPPQPMGSKNLMYISLELFVSPKVKFNDSRAPLQEMGFSISIGSITRKLTQEQTEVEWKP